MKEYKFTAYGEPVAKGRARSTRSGKHYTPRKTVIAEEAIRLQSVSSKPKAALESPINLKNTFFRSIPRSWSNKKQFLALEGNVYPVSKPDISNTVKTVEDALNKIYWNDDSQIVDLNTKKRYAAEPRTEIIVREIIP